MSYETLPTATREQIAKRARIELARRIFYEYCKLKYPKHYTEERVFLRELCNKLQWFIEQNEKRFLVVTIPPRHYKSFTGTNLIEWYFGNHPDKKAMTGSYNEKLSTTFARKVRDTIEEKAAEGGGLVYSDIFKKTKVRYGQASMSLWALEGDAQDNYLATSPTGTSTGFGANIGLIDDIIKSADEAYNQARLDALWDWFTNTMMQRTEGDDWKFIIIMTRWAKGDLAGRVIAEFSDEVEQISFSAVQPDGSMLCDDILNKTDYLIKTKNMNHDIAEANYNQKPIDVSGKLYEGFMTYDILPEFKKKWNYTDTADKGTDFLCSVNYVEINGDVYITDVVHTDAAMEVTEPLVAQLLDTDEVNEAIIESNNGGRGFARNIQRIMNDDLANRSCVVQSVPQTSNKEARILSSSAWVQRHVFMPKNWSKKYPEFYDQLFSYQKKGKNKHDDAPDVLAAIYEQVTGKSKFEFSFG